MSAAQTTKLLLPTIRVSLDFLGDRWKDAYVVFRDLPYSEYKAFRTKSQTMDSATDEEAESELIKVIQENFVEGKTLDADGAMVEMSKEMFSPENFSLRALTTFHRYVIGAIDPKG